jgi:sphingomyelin phosphodiesterase acid-like 3
MFAARRWLTFIVLSLTLFCSGAASAQSHIDYLFTSDIHLNPMDDPKLTDRLAAAPIAQWDQIFAADHRPYANYLADTNAALFQLALAQMRATIPNPQVVFISGDFLAHNYRAQWNAAASDKGDAAFGAFVDKTIAYIAQEFNAAFPRAPFVITLGNNDSPCGDYAAAPHSAFLAHFEQAWEPLVNRDGRAPDFAREFVADGDYVGTLPNGTRTISVNSNPWSPAAATACDPANSARGATIAWLETAVAASPTGARTWLVEHIPPGIDAYSSARKQAPVQFYLRELLARFRAVRAHDGTPLGLIIAAHLHNDGFRIVDESPLMLVPSISPVHANNPSFFVAHVDATSGTIADYDAYALDLPAAIAGTANPPTFAHEYAFDAAYGVQGFTLASLAKLQQSIYDDTQHLRETEAAYYVSGSKFMAISAQTWYTFWCSNANLDAASFERCLTQPSH